MVLGIDETFENILLFTCSFVLDVLTVSSSFSVVVFDSLSMSVASSSCVPMLSFRDLIAWLRGVPCSSKVLSPLLYNCFNSYDKSSRAPVIFLVVVLFGMGHFVGKNSTALLSLTPFVAGI